MIIISLEKKFHVIFDLKDITYQPTETIQFHSLFTICIFLNSTNNPFQ